MQLNVKVSVKRNKMKKFEKVGKNSHISMSCCIEVAGSDIIATHIQWSKIEKYWTPNIQDLTHEFLGFIFVSVLLSAKAEILSVSHMQN